MPAPSRKVDGGNRLVHLCLHFGIYLMWHIQNYMGNRAIYGRSCDGSETNDGENVSSINFSIVGNQAIKYHT